MSIKAYIQWKNETRVTDNGRMITTIEEDTTSIFKYGDELSDIVTSIGTDFTNYEGCGLIEVTYEELEGFRMNNPLKYDEYWKNEPEFMELITTTVEPNGIITFNCY